MKKLIQICTIAAFVGGFGPVASAQDVLSGHQAGALLEVRDVKSSPDGSVSGTVVNNSKTVVRDVKLLVRYAWIWKNERHPGDDSPGRSQYVPVAGDIPAGGSTPFSYAPNPPLPSRTDGSFQTNVSVQGFTQVGE